MSKTARSPRHPSFGLGEALNRIRDFYKINGRAHVSPDVAVQAWKYTGLNGASLRTLATMRQYGLLDEVGKDVRISPLALTLMVEPENSPDYTAAIQQAAMSPRIFVETLEEFPHGLPADQGVISFLIRKKHFAEDSARKVTAVLRDTLDLVEPYSARGILGTDDSPSAGSGASGGAEQGSAGQGAPSGQDGGSGGAPSRNEPEGKVMRYEYALPEGKATLVLSGDNLSAEDIEDVYAWLEVMKRTIQRSINRRGTRLPSALGGGRIGGEDD